LSLFTAERLPSRTNDHMDKLRAYQSKATSKAIANMISPMKEPCKGSSGKVKASPSYHILGVHKPNKATALDHVTMSRKIRDQAKQTGH
jgi:hypothetical protein